jgi:hypothetical protein
MYSLPQLFAIPSKHELEELSDRLRILLDLLLRIGIHDSQSRVYVPLVRVYAEGDVLLDVLDATDVASGLPRKLVVRRPGCAHAEEGGMSDSLSVRRDAIVLVGGEVDVLGLEARHYSLNKGEVGIGSAMLDQDQRLPLWIDTWAVEGVYGDDADVFGKILFECANLWGLARRLPSNDSADFGSCAHVSVDVEPVLVGAIQGPKALTTASMFLASTL